MPTLLIENQYGWASDFDIIYNGDGSMNCTHALTSNKLLQVIESENNVLTGPKQAVKKSAV